MTTKAEQQIERLVNHFGGHEEWELAARQIDTWGRSQLSNHLMEALSTTYEGVLAMYQMMTSSDQIEQSFIANFEAEIHEQYRHMGSKLRNTVRTQDNIVGATTSFERLEAKDAHVECVLQDYYAGDWVDRLDELKTNTKDRRLVARAVAYALGRKTDEIIVNQLANSYRSAGWPDERLTRYKIQIAFEMLDKTDVDPIGQRFAVVGWEQWSDLFNIDEFANADYINEEQLPWKGTQAKKWLGTIWIPHSGLPKINGVRHCFWYYNTAIGHGIGSDVKTDITWYGDHAAHFVNSMMSQGACLIDGSGS